MRANILALMLLAAAATLQAGELYRWVDEDGKVHYTDQRPPPEARSAERKKLGDRPGDGPVSFALQQATKKFPVTLYVAEGCTEACKLAVAYLSKRGIPFTQKDARQDADALKALTGGVMEVPVATVGSGTVLRGYEEGAWKTAFDTAGYPSAPLVPARGAAAPKPTPATPGPTAAAPSPGAAAPAPAAAPQSAAN